MNIIIPKGESLWIILKRSGSGIIECNTQDDYQKKLLKYFKSR